MFSYCCVCKLLTITSYTLFKTSQNIVSSCQHSGSECTATVLSSISIFHKSTTHALKNVCPNAPFSFLNNLYLALHVAVRAFLGANSKNFSHCSSAFFSVIIL